MKETRYWIATGNEKMETALKVESTPKDFRMTQYNKLYPKGRSVTGTNYYKIAMGRNADYTAVDAGRFKEFLNKKGYA